MADETLQSCETIFRDDTQYTADSVEKNPVYDVFACATYQLVKSLQCRPGDNNYTQQNSEANSQRCGPNHSEDSRIGSVRLYSIRTKDDNRKVNEERKRKSYDISMMQNIDLQGILDMKWSLCGNSLYTANSDGGLSIFSFTQNKGISLESSLIVDKSLICMSLDLSEHAKSSKPDTIFTCFTSGTIAVIDTECLTVTNKWKGHDFDAWVVARDYWSSHLMYSGGDDCKFRTWDLRVPEKAVYASKAHSMGVCSIQSSRKKENILLTGSYDEHVLVWDVRNRKSPICELETGGGVWRLKWHPHIDNIFLAACMHDGFKIYQAKDGVSYCLTHSYQEHKSLAYGADWLTLHGGFSKNAYTLVASCSFYDHLLTVWDPFNIEL